MNLKRLFLLSIIVVVVALAVALYSEDEKHSAIDFRVKVVDLIEHGLFYASGMYHGTNRFNRKIWEFVQIKVGPGLHGLLEYDNVLSVDVKIPSLWKRDEGTNHQIVSRIFFPERLHTNFTNPDFNEKFPVFIYYHGGGFVVLQYNDMFYDFIARDFVKEGDFIVVLVDYRLAPENKFPAGLMDSYSVAVWALEGSVYPEYTKYFDREKVIVGGDSAGGSLANSVSMLVRDRKDTTGKIAMQVLLYPGTYYNGTTESFEKYGDNAYMLPQGKLTARWFHDQYADNFTNFYNLIDADDYDKSVEDDYKNAVKNGYTEPESFFPFITQPYLNPWVANLTDLPFTHLVAAECDPLRDEGLLYIERLKEYGVPTEVTLVNSTAHGFYVLNFLAESKYTRSRIIGTIRSELTHK